MPIADSRPLGNGIILLSRCSSSSFPRPPNRIQQAREQSQSLPLAANEDSRQIWVLVLVLTGAGDVSSFCLRPMMNRRPIPIVISPMVIPSARMVILWILLVSTIKISLHNHHVFFAKAIAPSNVDFYEQQSTTASASASVQPDANANAHGIDITKYGLTNFQEGMRLFQLGHYEDASAYLWRAILLHDPTKNDNDEVDGAASQHQHYYYRVDDAFSPFLQCYHRHGRVADGLIFVSVESYLRGQDDMGELYLKQALQMMNNAGHSHDVSALELQRIIAMKNTALKMQQLKELRDKVDLSKTRDRVTNENMGSTIDGADDFWSQFKAEGRIQTSSTTLSPQSSSTYTHDTTIETKSPEELYNMATLQFNIKNLPRASELFELSCQKSDKTLTVACTNAIYLRTNLCDWGQGGLGFERDMEYIKQVTYDEVLMYRSEREGGQVSEEMKRLFGMGYSGNSSSSSSDNNTEVVDRDVVKEVAVIHWQRTTSVHPHMMLGYPLGNEHSILKRYVAESMAGLDELRARVDEGDDGNIKDRPTDLPYRIDDDMRDKFLKKHRAHLFNDTSPVSSIHPPIKVGFFGCGFNSKAVLYLSHDMFRYFDPSVVEIHIFSTGAPDHPRFIQETMRGVDWRQRVIDSVDHFHDVRKYKHDHIGLARYIHECGIEILIDWDGYARQGERAAGLLALRPAPIQILHQEFLMTSGAQYVDYIVTDRVVSPLQLQSLYTEKFIYLPNHFFSKGHAVQKEVRAPTMEYPQKVSSEFQLGVGSPQDNACLSSNPLGNAGTSERQNVSFVYCNFNKFLKNNPETMRSWIRILQDVPNSILCLLENPKEAVANLRKFVEDVTSVNASNGDITSTNINGRIHFIPWEKNPFDHQRRSYSLCNAMLDSYPYNGHTTAQDALYAGVPIVTRSDGDDMSSRVTTSANIVLGLEELNAYNGIEEYENIAIRLGTDETWFESIRATLVTTCLQKNPMHPYWDVSR